MPPEWAPHKATWMGFPTGAYPSSGVSSEDVFKAWASVANLVVDHEPVHMLCRPSQLQQAKKYLSSAVILHPAEINDAWLRDTGPTWVVDHGQVRAIDWRFNGWGDNTSFDWEADALVASKVAELTETPVDVSALTNEGGGIHVNGQTTVLLTESVQSDPNRNPDWDRDRIESEIHAQLGTNIACWFSRGLYRDYQNHGTRGHVDVFACFNEGGDVLLHRQLEKSHPDYERYSEHRKTLEQAGLPHIDVPAPKKTRDNIDWVDYSYLNHYVCNGAVILPTFEDPHDELVTELLTDAWPGREIRQVDARVIFAMGGGVHCITQQQPAI